MGCAASLAAGRSALLMLGRYTSFWIVPRPVADLFCRSAVLPPITTKSRGPQEQVRATLLGSTLAAAKAEMDAAAKAAQEEAKKKAEERKKKSEKPTDKPGDPVPSIVPISPAPAATASLFGDSQPTAS